MSNDEFDNTIPVNPPNVNKKIKPKTHQKDGVFKNLLPYIVLNHLKNFNSCWNGNDYSSSSKIGSGI